MNNGVFCAREKSLRSVQLLVEKGNADAMDCDAEGRNAYETCQINSSYHSWLLSQEVLPPHILKTREGYPLWFWFLFHQSSVDNVYRCMPHGRVCQETAVYRAPTSIARRSYLLRIIKGSNLLHGVFSEIHRVGLPSWDSF